MNTIHKANQHSNEQKIRCYNKTKIKIRFTHYTNVCNNVINNTKPQILQLPKQNKSRTLS